MMPRLTMRATACQCFTLCSLIGFLAFAPDAWAQEGPACDAASVAATFRSGHLAQLEAIYRRAREPRSTCPAKTTFCTGRLVGILYRNAVIAGASTMKTGELRETIRKGKSFGAPWQLLVAEGDLEFEDGLKGDKRAYGRAARAYEMAVNDLAEEPACAAFGEPGAPPSAQIAGLRRRMTEAKLLAPAFELVRTRDGQCGGVFLTKVRGFAAESTPLPIEFDTDSTTFTAKGRQAADALAECVTARSFASIRLTGHADMRGTDDYNMKLSARRLQAVKQLLVDRGFTGRIVLEPKGKRQPYRSADAGRLSEDEILQLNRRVELAGGEP